MIQKSMIMYKTVNYVSKVIKTVFDWLQISKADKFLIET